jgi:6-phosphogluconolactonase
MAGMRPEVIVEPLAELTGTFAARFAAAARAAQRDRGRFAVAVPGGSVATTLLPALASASVNWQRIELFWTDERAVPPADPESNYAAARFVWLDRVPIDPQRVHRMHGDAPDLQAAALEYEQELRATLGDPPRFDVVLLGIGPDGHVASLFPRHAVLEATRWVAAVEAAPKPPPQRLTLTLPALGAARQVWLAAFGPGKSAAVQAAFENADLPVSRVMRSGCEVTLWLDPPAAALL